MDREESPTLAEFISRGDAAMGETRRMIASLQSIAQSRRRIAHAYLRWRPSRRPRPDEFAVDANNLARDLLE